MAGLQFPLAESPFYDQNLHGRTLTAGEQAQLETYRRDGLLAVDLFDRDDPVLGEAVAGTAPLIGKLHRVQDAWRRVEAVRQIACHPKMLALLELLYGRAPFPFQTLNFPVGSQQMTHADTIHFNCAPERFMCGVWVALEDIEADSGPLHYYPGSHNLPVYSAAEIGFDGTDSARTDAYEKVYEPFVQKLVRAHGLRKAIATPRRGQALIWAANLLHGGEPIARPGATRHSQVTHYFFQDCLWYTPLLSAPERGAMRYRLPVDIRSGRLVEPSLLGRRLRVPLRIRLSAMLREWRRDTYAS